MRRFAIAATALLTASACSETIEYAAVETTMCDDGQAFTAFVSADFNGDWYDDVAAACGAGGGVALAMAVDDGHFEAAGTLLAGETVRSIAFVEADSDRIGDLLAVTTNGLAILSGHGDGSFDDPLFIPLPDGVAGAPVFNDIDDDRDDDILFPESGDTLLRRGRLAAGAFTPGTLPGWTDHARGFVADVDGDGKDDAIWTRVETGAIRVAYSGGDKYSSFLLADDTGLVRAVYGGDDFNFDTVDDLLVATEDGALRIAMSETTGEGLSMVIDGWTLERAAYQSSAPPRFAAIFRANRDRRVDIVAIDADGGALRTLIGKGRAAFELYEPAHLIAPPPDGVTVGDVDGDGEPDVLLRYEAGRRLVVLRNPRRTN